MISKTIKVTKVPDKPLLEVEDHNQNQNILSPMEKMNFYILHHNLKPICQFLENQTIKKCQS